MPAQQVFEQLGAPRVRPAAWNTLSADLTGFAGNPIRIVVRVSDAWTASTVEAAVDDMRITEETRGPTPAPAASIARAPAGPERRRK